MVLFSFNNTVQRRQELDRHDFFFQNLSKIQWGWVLRNLKVTINVWSFQHLKWMSRRRKQNVMLILNSNIRRIDPLAFSWKSFTLMRCVSEFSSSEMFAKLPQNDPKWTGKLWSLIVKTFNFDAPAEHVFVKRMDR